MNVIQHITKFCRRLHQIARGIKLAFSNRGWCIAHTVLNTKHSLEILLVDMQEDPYHDNRKDIQRIKITLEHIERWMNIWDYVGEPPIEWSSSDPENQIPLENGCVRIKACPSILREWYFKVDELEDWHYSMIWYYINKYGKYWST